MTSDRKVFQILESIADSGISAEEACADQPELLSEVREQLAQCRLIDAEIDELFGPPGRADLDLEGSDLGPLPRVPGYQLISIRGRGGMGIVYRARHLELNRIVALKMMLRGEYAGSVERSRFVREARAIAGLRHEHIIQIYDVGEADDCPYFTMEFIEGETLSEFLDGDLPTPKQAADLLLKLATAVEYAHQRGIVHRDLKPSNILIDTGGTPKIGDFGLARNVAESSDLTLSGGRIGTPNYMAPEQALGRSDLIGPTADVYSLGAILYEALTGRPPFRGQTAADTERQLLQQEPVPPCRLNNRVPRNLETICLKCLQKQPIRRYASAADLAKDIERFQSGVPILARKTGVIERSTK